MNQQLLDIIDLDIIQINLSFADDYPSKSGFCRFACVDNHMAVAVRNLILDINVEHPICHDISGFIQKIEDAHQHEFGVSDESIDFERPCEVDDYVAECTPQFILRNIPKLEKYYDLERALPFMIDDMPIIEAIADIHDVRHAKLDPPQFSDHSNIEFINDFRTFLEEIFVLCPWDQASRHAPAEDSPWHLKNSTTKLAKDLLEHKNTFFVFGTRGMTTMQLGDYQPEKDKKQNDNNRPGGIGMPTFGPGI